MLWDFLNQAYRLPMMVFKRALSNPMGIFVYGILTKWYAIIMIATIIVTYWVFKGLEKAGVLDLIDRRVKSSLIEVQAVAQNCTPLIMNLQDMWNCVQNPPPYISDVNDKSLTEGLMLDAANTVQSGVAYGNKGNKGNKGNATKSSPDTNPYDDDDDDDDLPIHHRKHNQDKRSTDSAEATNDQRNAITQRDSGRSVNKI
jgi:hypothetical protein